MKKIFLSLALLSSATYLMHAKNEGDKPSLSSLMHLIEQGALGTDGQVGETIINVFVYFSIPQVNNNAAGVRFELRRHNSGLYAWVRQRRFDGSGLWDCRSFRIPTLPCEVLVEEAWISLISPTVLQVKFPKVPAAVEESVRRLS